jgi:hypothetical protein
MDQPLEKPVEKQSSLLMRFFVRAFSCKSRWGVDVLDSLVWVAICISALSSFYKHGVPGHGFQRGLVAWGTCLLCLTKPMGLFDV